MTEKVYKFLCVYILVFTTGVAPSAFSTQIHDHDHQPSSSSSLDLGKIQHMMKKMEKLKAFQEEDLTDDLGSWEAPMIIQENFPYYLSSYDDEGKPIWIIELGKMDMRVVIEKGKDMMEAMDKAFKQLAYRILQSMKNQSRENNPVTEALFLVDCQGLEMRQLTYMPNLVTMMKVAFQFRELVMRYMGASILINANFLTETVFRLVKPAFGVAVAKIDVYGTKKRKWLPVLRRVFGPENIPEAYGGTNKKFKPIAIYG